MKTLPLRGISPVIIPHLYFGGQPNETEAYTQDAFSRARFDLLRLETARKIYKLEQGKEPERIEELIPDYLPEAPFDIFSKNRSPYREKPFYYSIGPDGVDQKGARLYDPTNGTISAGDVFLTME